MSTLRGSRSPHAALVGLALACGGGSSGSGLSAAQSAYETVALASHGGVHDLLWSLPASGAPSGADHDFFVDIASGGLAASPSTGPQSQTSTWTSLGSSLAAPGLPLNVNTPTPTSGVGPPPSAGATLRLPGMVVKNGAVLVTSADPTHVLVSYVGNDVRIDSLATDGSTVTSSELVTAVSLFPVSGAIASAGGDVGAWLSGNNLLANTALLEAGASFLPGAAYLEYTARRSGDTLFTDDCADEQTSTSAAGLVPCRTGKTLDEVATTKSYADGTGGTSLTYTLATDGTICEVSAQGTTPSCPSFGVRYWISATPRAKGANVPPETTAFRAYFELGGNVYSGAVQRDGAALGTNVGSDAAPDVRPWQLRVNGAFADSVRAALAF